MISQINKLKLLLPVTLTLTLISCDTDKKSDSVSNLKDINKPNIGYALGNEEQISKQGYRNVNYKPPESDLDTDSLLGNDTNNNYIRDDLEAKFIKLYSGERAYLLPVVAQGLILNQSISNYAKTLDNSQLLQILELMDNFVTCSTLLTQESDKIFTAIKMFHFNNKERLESFNIFKEAAKNVKNRANSKPDLNECRSIKPVL